MCIHWIASTIYVSVRTYMYIVISHLRSGQTASSRMPSAQRSRLRDSLWLTWTIHLHKNIIIIQYHIFKLCVRVCVCVQVVYTH